jgi:hypothetical protein
MKKTSALCLAIALALGVNGTAQAEHHHHGHGGGYYAPPPDYGYYRHREHHHSSSWVGPAAVLAITGLTLGAMAYNRASEPVYVAPPPPPPQPSQGLWYYCASSGQYYPYTNACPEGWRTVMP